MKRVDHRKTVHQTWEANYNAPGRATVDQSTTELSGSRREADLVVRGLMALKAQIIMNQATGAAHSEWRDENLGKSPELEEVERLLGTVALPQYEGEPVVERQYL